MTTTDTAKLDRITNRYGPDEKKIIRQIQFTFNCTRTKAIELYRANR